MQIQTNHQLILSRRQHQHSSNRLFALDLLKAISIVAVVSYHSIFLPRSAYASSLPMMEILFSCLRFCVPVLFTISFLLLERGLTHPLDTPIWALGCKRFYRVLVPTVFWFTLAAGLKYWRGNDLPELLRAIANGTIFQGAYFLLVLLLCLPLYLGLRRIFTQPKSLLCTILLQSSVFVGIYCLLLGIPGLPDWLPVLQLLGRPALIYWFAYMALGAYLWRNWATLVRLSKRIAGWSKIWFISITGMLLVIEYSWLFWLSSGQVPPFDYAMVSCMTSVFIAFLCAASIEPHQLPSSIQTVVKTLSKYSLGIFCINGILSEVLLSVGSHLMAGVTVSLLEILVLKIAGWIVLLTVSLGLAMLLDRAGLGAVVR